MKTKRSKVKVKESLTEGLVTGVLSRLCVKTLIRFRCVSQDWNAMIGSAYFAAIRNQCSDPRFSALLQHAISPLADSEVCDGILLLRNKSTIVGLDLPFLEWGNRNITLNMVGSNSGLVYLSLFEKERVEGSTRIIVWNPAVNQFRYLPELIPLNDHGDEHLAPVLGLGFIDDSSDYKLVRLGVRSCMLNGSFPKVRLLCQVHIYTRSANSWRNLENFPSCVVQHCDPITLRGIMYVLARDCKLNSLNLVLSFSLRDEVFHAIPAPYDTPSAKIFSWENSLAFVAHDHVQRSWEIYVMAEESEIGTRSPWTKQLCIPTSVGRLFGVWQNEILVGRHDDSTEDEDLCWYDPINQRIRELTYEEPKYGYDFEKAINYVESNVPV